MTRSFQLSYARGRGAYCARPLFLSLQNYITMAKNNINLGTLSGKLGDNVFWRTHGQQRVRTYFKRTETNVGYEAALRRAQFANMKSIYQWLPDIFKKACNMYKVGGNSYADFMQQYLGYTMTRDKYNFGAGHFMPVNCPVSFGTWNINFKTKLGQVVALNQNEDEVTTKGIVFSDCEIDDSWVTVDMLSIYLLQYHPELREGDILHIMLGYIFWDALTWGQADAVEGLPFAYTGPYYAKIQLNTRNPKQIIEETNGLIMPCWSTGEVYDNLGFAISDNILPSDKVGSTSVVGSMMFERPQNTRRQRFTPAQLVFDRSQLDILSTRGKAGWRSYCAGTFTKNGE